MTDDDKALVERLRRRGPNGGLFCECGDLAADRIEALSAENEQLQFVCELNAVPAGIIEVRGRMAERAAIVAWLRQGGLWCDPIPSSIEHEYAGLADDIEAGEHLK